MQTDEDLDALLDELIDRFGEPTAPVLALLDIARIKNAARIFHARSIALKESALDIALPADEKLPLPALMRLDRAFGRRVGPLPEGSGYRIRLSARECRNVLDTVLEIVQLITGEQHE